MAYKYSGTIHDVEDEPTITTTPGEFDPSACGTYAGYRRHQTHNVPACQDCRDAQAAYSRGRYKAAPPRVFNPDACGTWRGWQRHLYYKTPPCEACREASRDYQRSRRVARKQVAA